MERWLSGRRHVPAKDAYSVKGYRGFKSHSFRRKEKDAPACVLLGFEVSAMFFAFREKQCEPAFTTGQRFAARLKEIPLSLMRQKTCRPLPERFEEIPLANSLALRRGFEVSAM